MGRRTTNRPVMTLIAALVLLASAAPVVAATTAEPAHAQEEEAPFSWWMEERYELGWRLYDKTTHSYPTEYLYPDGWEAGFDACESPLAGGGNATSYAWHIEGVDVEFTSDVGPTSNCRIDRETDPASPLFPAQGDYDVTLTVEFSDREPATASQTITIRDLLIVSIGDSNAAGEGNPHVNQVGGLRPVDGKWFEPRCHRSAISGHARSAAMIEANDPHTAVTFISFACSGAEIWTGLISHYYGIETPDNSLVLPLKPQAISIMEHLCRTTYADPSCIENPREIDSLFLSVGVNDIGFSSVLLSCAAEKKIKDIRVEDLWLPGIVDVLTGFDWEAIKDNPVDYLFGPLDEIFLNQLDFVLDIFGKSPFACGDKLEPILEMNFAALWSHYALLGEVLDGEAGRIADDLEASDSNYGWMTSSLRNRFTGFYGDLPESMTQSIVPDEVYITSYPGDPFRDENGFHTGCGIFDGISPDDAAWIEQQGRRLNRHIEWEAEKHRWHFVGGIIEGFEGHGYCAGGDSYYVHFTDSYLNQSNYQGTMHPNSDGHNVTRDRLLDVYYGEKPDWSAKHGVTVTVEAARITDNRANPQGSSTFTAKIHDEWYRHEHMIKQIEMPVGEWFNLPESQFQFQADLADDEMFTVLAHTTAGGGIYYPPKCRTPDCAQVIPATTLRTERDYALTNGWGGSYEWCENQPAPNYYTSQRICTVAVGDADFTLEVRYRITVVNLALSPAIATRSPGNQVVCGEYCQATTEPAFSILEEYLEVLEAAGEDTTLITALLAYTEASQVAR